MKHNVEDILKRAHDIRLTDSEKSLLLSAIEKEIDAGVPSSVIGAQTFRPTPVKGYYFLLHTMYSYRTPIALVILFAFGAGTSYAAQGALPGDTLYPVKIHVNEGVESVLALDPSAAAKVSAKHALTRLEEVESLAEKGNLDATTTAQLHDQFSQESSVAQAKIEKVREVGDTEDADSIRSEFTGHLREHHDKVRRFADLSSTTNPALADLQKSIEQEFDGQSGDVQNSANGSDVSSQSQRGASRDEIRQGKQRTDSVPNVSGGLRVRGEDDGNMEREGSDE